MKNTIHFITIVALLFIPVSAKADVYSTLQSEVAALTTSTPFVNVVATDKKVTEAASAGLITKAQYDLLDATIINIYRNSTAFSQLSYSSMPADPNHQNRTGNHVMIWGDNVTITGDMTIASGATVVFIPKYENHNVTMRRDMTINHSAPLITVNGTLIIKADPGHSFIIDGGNTIQGSYTNGGELCRNTTLGGVNNNFLVVLQQRVNTDHPEIRCSNVVFRNNKAATGSGSGVLFSGGQQKTAAFFNTSFTNIWNVGPTTSPVIGSAVMSSGATYSNTLLADGNSFSGIMMSECSFDGNLVDNMERPGENAKMQNGGSCFGVQGGNLDLRITKSSFTSNYCSWHGGAIFWNLSSGTIDLRDNIFANNYAGLGGAVYVQGKLNLSNCSFIGNHAEMQHLGNPQYFNHPAFCDGNGFDGCGGAVYIQPSCAGGQAADCELVLNDCMFNDNYADIDGGAVFVYTVNNANEPNILDVNLKIKIKGNTIISSNEAGRCGGAIAINLDPYLNTNIDRFHINSSIDLIGGILTENKALGINGNDRATFPGTGFGGGLFVDHSPVSVTDGFTISDNESKKDGGAIYVGAGNFNAGAINVNNNTSVEGNGGAFCVNGGDVTLTGATFNSNFAYLKSGDASGSGCGGAFCVHDGNIDIYGGSMDENHADLYGGAFYLSNGNLRLHTSPSISSNNAYSGGGIFVDDGDMVFDSGSLLDNTAQKFGGGAYIAGGNVSFKGNIVNNTALNGGGLYLASGAQMTFKGGLIINNGAIQNSSSPATTAYRGTGGSTIEGCGGGIYLQNGSNSTHKTTLNFELDPLDKTFGLYTNKAAKGGDDIVSEGQYTEVVLPSVREMQLYGFDGQDATPFWYQDYFTDDTGYSNSDGHAVEGTVSHVDRFRNIIEQYTNDYFEHRIPDERLETIKNNYLCLTLSYNMLDITLTANHLLGKETALFQLVRHGSVEDKKYDVLLKAGADGIGSRTLRNMPWGTYSVIPNDSWNWAYDKIPPQFNLRLGETGNYEFIFDMKHKNAATMPNHDERYK